MRTQITLKRGLGLVLAVAAAGLASSFVAPLPAQNPRPVPARDAVRRGEPLYVAQCAFCHGEDGRGGESGAADLLRSQLALDDESGSTLGPFLADGRPNRGMPSFTFSQSDLVDLAAYVREIQRGAIFRNNYPIINVMTGNAERGRAFFNGAGGCTGCHSITGNLAGIGSKYEPHILQVRMLYPNRGRGARPVMASVIPRFGGTPSRGELQYQDDFTVQIRDADGYTRSFSTKNVRVVLDDPYKTHLDLLPKYTNEQMHDVLTFLGTIR